VGITTTGGLSVTGASTLVGAATASGGLTAGVGITTTGGLSVTGASTLVGAATASGGLTADVGITTTGVLSVTGASTLVGGVTASNNITATGFAIGSNALLGFNVISATITNGALVAHGLGVIPKVVCTPILSDGISDTLSISATNVTSFTVQLYNGPLAAFSANTIDINCWAFR
jgi:hypothetical protein